MKKLSRAELIEIFQCLVKDFPGLVTDEEVNGSDLIDRVSRIAIYLKHTKTIKVQND